MKLSKKDKIMVLMLAVIMFVAVFVVYGILPNKDTITELDAQIATKTAAVNELQARLAALAGQQMDGKIKAVLDFYYDNRKPSEMPELLDRIAIEQMMYVFLDEYHVEGYSTTGWNVTPSEYSSTYDDMTVTNSYYVAQMSIQFKMEKKEWFRPFIDRLNTDTNFRLTSYDIREETRPEGEPTTPPEGTEPEKFYEVTGSMNVEYYMGENYYSDLMDLVKVMEGKPDISASKDTMIVKKLDSSKWEKCEYTPYSVVVDEAGNKTFTKIPKGDYTMSETLSTVEFKFTRLAGDTDVTVVAMGGIAAEKRFYKSVLDNNTPHVTVKVG